MKTTLQEPYHQFFGTLANQVRLDIISVLLRGKKNVGMITKETNYPQPTVSHSLRRLDVCGFVHARQDGKERWYSLNEKTITPLFHLMNTHMNAYCKHVVEARTEKSRKQNKHASQASDHGNHHGSHHNHS